jgi:hypothetical protein
MYFLFSIKKNKNWFFFNYLFSHDYNPLKQQLILQMQVFQLIMMLKKFVEFSIWND